jgi:hypothetical protein
LHEEESEILAANLEKLQSNKAKMVQNPDSDRKWRAKTARDCSIVVCFASSMRFVAQSLPLARQLLARSWQVLVRGSALVHCRTQGKCAEAGLNYSCLKAPEELQENEFFKALPLREQQAIAFFCAVNPPDTIVALDTSQCVSRTVAFSVSVLLSQHLAEY